MSPDEEYEYYTVIACSYSFRQLKRLAELAFYGMGPVDRDQIKQANELGS